jgi:hypothetical protein
LLRAISLKGGVKKLTATYSEKNGRGVGDSMYKKT